MSRPAFTLIELLVVLSIIALLLALLLPSLGHARATAQDVRCKANLRSLQMANQTYMVDHRNVPIRSGFEHPDTCCSTFTFFGFRSWHYKMAVQLGQHDVYYGTYDTPGPDQILYVSNDTYRIDLTNPLSIRSLARNTGVMECPEAPYIPEARQSTSVMPVFDLSPSGQALPGGSDATRGGRSAAMYIRVRSDRTASMMVFAADANGSGIGANNIGSSGWGKPVYRHFNSAAINEGSPTTPRGNGTANLVFMDGHVRSFNDAELVAEAPNLTFDLLRNGHEGLQ